MPDSEPAYPSKVGVDVPDDWEPPNVVFVVADDMGRSDLGCYGGDMIETPNMDRMAAEGTRFTDCYSGHAVCAPSRDVLLTGRHTGHTTIRNNMSGRGVGGMRVVDERSLQHRVGLAADDVTVAEYLSEQGYATGGAGKWGVGEGGTEAAPENKGFDRFFGYLNQRRAHTYWPPFLWKDGERISYPGNEQGPSGENDGPYSHGLIEDFGMEFLQQHADDRFFLYLPFTLPHSELAVPEVEEYVDESWSEEEQAYASMVTRFDAAVGRVLDLLEEHGIDDETAVFVTSDNGAGPYPDEPFDGTGPLRGSKGDLYEGGIRVPMVARWPGMIPEGEVREDPWYFADVLPTFAEMAGLPQPSMSGDVDGISVLPTLLGEEQGLDNRFLYWEDPGDGLAQAARYDTWKAYRPDRGSPTELYDLAEDVGEEHDVSDEHPEVVGKFERYFADAHEESPHWPSW